MRTVEAYKRVASIQTMKYELFSFTLITNHCYIIQLGDRVTYCNLQHFNGHSHGILICISIKCSLYHLEISVKDSVVRQ